FRFLRRSEAPLSMEKLSLVSIFRLLAVLLRRPSEASRTAEAVVTRAAVTRMS
ncbi:hypothetical protein BGZ81_002362, partial [Podila clonocystis]